MKPQQESAAAPSSQPAQDPHAGQGGSYELDPATGQRTLIHRTAEPATTAQATQPQSKE